MKLSHFPLMLPLLILALPLKAQSTEGGAWSPLFNQNNTLYPMIDALVTDEAGHVYVGGTRVDAGAVHGVAKWDGTAWETFGSGFNGTVTTLVFSPTGDLYAGGVFTTADGHPANGIAKWSGSTWEALGSGVDNTDDPGGGVFAIAFDEQGLAYVGGDFNQAGGEPATGIATWDGSQWQELGGGVDGFGCFDSHQNNVYAITIAETGGVYVGGDFHEAGGSPMWRVAKWTGTAWEALGSGIAPEQCGTVFELAFHGGALYAGGSFDDAGEGPAENIARWTGAAWAALGVGVSDSRVLALASHPSGLYVGGFFDEAGGMTVNRIARWSEEQWWSLGTGVTGGTGAGQVWAISTYENSVYVGGYIAEAGGVESVGLALWQVGGTTAIEEQPVPGLRLSGAYPNPFHSRIEFEFELASTASVRVELYDLLGRRVEVLVNHTLQAGKHSVPWEAGALPSGLYMAKLRVGLVVQSLLVTKF